MSAPYIHTYPPEKEKQLQLGQLLINNNIRGLIAVTGTLDQVSDSFSSDYVTSENYLGGYLAGSPIWPAKIISDWLCCRPQGCLYDCPENFRFSERTKECKTSCLSGALLL